MNCVMVQREADRLLKIDLAVWPKVHLAISIPTENCFEKTTMRRYFITRNLFITFSRLMFDLKRFLVELENVNSPCYVRPTYHHFKQLACQSLAFDRLSLRHPLTPAYFDMIMKFNTPRKRGSNGCFWRVMSPSFDSVNKHAVIYYSE